MSTPNPINISIVNSMVYGFYWFYNAKEHPFCDNL